MTIFIYLNEICELNVKLNGENEKEFSFNIRTSNIMTTLNELEKIAQEHSNSRAINLVSFYYKTNNFQKCLLIKSSIFKFNN